MEQIKLRVIGKEFAVCQISSFNDAVLNGKYVFLSKTDEELSLVCEAECVPKDTVKCEMGFSAFKITGVLDFGLIGIKGGSPIEKLVI